MLFQLTRTTTPAPDYIWTQMAPEGGFVSAVQYHPTRNGEVWASGDDSSGLYKSLDSGGSWNLITTTPPNHSTYAFAFDPGNADVLYAPNHFGRGLLKSVDAGLNWTLYTNGLPTASSTQRINDIAVDPNNGQLVYMALAGGLYKSVDAGANFSKITSPTFDGNTDNDFTAIAISGSSDLYLGSNQGRVYKSVDSGSSWTELTAGAYVKITDIELTNNALYVAFQEGTILKSATFNGTFTFVNNATAGGAIESGLWTKIKAVSGADANSDILYIGTVYKPLSVKWGFHVSTDGGTTLVKRVNGLNNSSAFNLSVNPFNSSEIIMATINNGIYRTTDQGLNWTPVGSGVHAQASLAFAEDPSNADHLLMSSTAGLVGTSKLLETFNGGNSWSEVPFFADKSVRTVWMPTGNGNTIVAGTFSNGFYKTTTGSGGTWTQTTPIGSIVNRIRAHPANPNKLYAASYEPNAHADLGIYYSMNGGDSWSKVSAISSIDVIPHPVTEDEAIALSGDVLATTDSFATIPNSLGLSAFAPGQWFFSAAFIPDHPTSLLVGSSAGKLYRTDNYNASGAGVTWREIPVPTADVIITDIVAKNANVWYLVCWIGDIFITRSSTPGMLRTTDGGQTWEFLDSGLFPSRLPFKMKQSSFDPASFYVGTWGGGFYKLSDPK